MNSVHKRHLSRAAVGYDCIYDHCRGNGKIFWRLDNFRNHLKKKHDPKGSKEVLEEFLKRYVASFSFSNPCFSVLEWRPHICGTKERCLQTGININCLIDASTLIKEYKCRQYLF